MWELEPIHIVQGGNSETVIYIVKKGRLWSTKPKFMCEAWTLTVSLINTSAYL